MDCTAPRGRPVSRVVLPVRSMPLQKLYESTRQTAANAPRLFAAISLLIIALMVVGTGLIQAPFFRQTIIDREATIVRDMVNALALANGLSAEDLRDQAAPEGRRRLDQSFRPLKKLPNIGRIKVFNRDNTIVWSDDPALIGSVRKTHLERLTRAMGGQVQATFNSVRSDASGDAAADSGSGMIECYVPLLAYAADRSAPAAIGVLSLYRDSEDLNRTIRGGVYLLWAIIGATGLLLFFALFWLFTLVHNRQQTAELKFSRLSDEHERIVQVEKMSAMGELVANIAHQLNNPLVGVINMTQLAQRQSENTRVSELLADIRKAGTECRDIVHRILRISQISRSELQAIHLRDLIEDTITFCRQSMNPHQPLHFTAPERKAQLQLDPVLMRQALFNLIHNAILAAPGSPVQVAMDFEPREGVPGVVVSVTDSGAGFSPEVASRLFKPFFTTRANGTGLGLSVAQHIVMKHGGVLLAENRPAGGARFSIWLPETGKA